MAWPAGLMEFPGTADKDTRRIMVFLLFLASLAVAHYVVTRSGMPSIPGSEPPEEKAADLASPAVRAAATAAGLAALGHALEEQGRGPAPQSAEVPRVLEAPKSG